MKHKTAQMRRPEWPKRPPQLTPAQENAREQFMLAWHELLPTRYALLERFNHSALGHKPTASHIRTLEIGAGIGAHVQFEDLTTQEYHCLESRAEFCARLRSQPGIESVVMCSIEQRTPFESGTFDRIIAIHVLEHLRDLPAALHEIDRLLKPTGVFEVVLPCEGGIAYAAAREISAKRYFERRFKMKYMPIVRNEHVSTFEDVMNELNERFVIDEGTFFPLKLPWYQINLCAAFRLRKRN